MKVLIISPGKTHDHTIAEGIAEYQKRFSARLALEWSMPAVGTKDSEGVAILKLIKEPDFVVLLDERGKDIDTVSFSSLLEQHLKEGTKRMVFIIGGSFGVSEVVATRADKTLKLSSLVFPHMLVRLILIEQIYRADSILGGSKYHHA